MTLKLNEEQQGLKLIQVNDGFVVVEKNDVEVNDFFLDRGYHNILKCTTASVGSFDRIIFATPNLNLEGVLEIEENIPNIDNELSHQEWIKEGKKGYPYYDWNLLLKTCRTFFSLGYKQAKQNLFTEEQVREAFQKGREYEYSLYYDQTYGYGDKRTIKESNVDDFIQSLKQPKVEITFENNVPTKAVMI